MRSDTNHCLGCFKGIACMCVVFIHVHFTGWFGDIVWRLSQFAVPLFFMISGYFAYSLDREWTERTLKRRARKILCLSIYATALYGSIGIFKDIIKMNVYIEGADVLLLKVVRFLILQDVDFSGGFHLWFLWALFWGYVVILGINRFDLWNISHRVLPLLIVAMVILSMLRVYYGWDFHSTGNISCSVTYLLIGHWLAENSGRLKTVVNHKLLITMCLGFIICLGYFLRPIFDFSYVGIIVASVAMISLAIKNKDYVISKNMEIIGEKYSLNIYIFHILVYQVLMKVEKIVGIHDHLLVLVTQPILVCLSTLALAFAIYWGNERICYFRRKYVA